MSWLQTYQFQNRLKRFHRLGQILLSLLLIIALNVIAMRYYQRVDLTDRHQFSLSPETRAYLSDLEQDIQIIITIPENAPREEDRTSFRFVENLLREYVYHARDGEHSRISVERVDIYKNQRRAEELSRIYGLTRQNAIIVATEDRYRFIYPDEILEFRDQQPVAFRGESAFTSAILEVIQDTSARIYFLQGHGEMSPDDVSARRGLSELTTELRARNFRVSTLDLTKVSEVPMDASLVVIADPQGPLLASELQKLRTYLMDRAGRLLLWSGPTQRTGLSPLLYEWGLLMEDQLVVERGADYIEGTGNLIVRRFTEHAITESLVHNQLFVVGGSTRPVRADPGAPFDDRLRITPLMASSETSWATRNHSALAFDPDQDLAGPVSIAAVAERRSAAQLGINIPGGRVVAFGTRDLFNNEKINSVGNRMLFFNTLNWMLDRDQLLAIPPRPIETYQLMASRSDLRRIGLWFLVIPGGIASLGMLVVWLRKI